MKIFISHSHQNRDAAKALVDMLLSSLSLEDNDIRCTSVPGHQLRFGKTISELLKKDINLAPVFIALISKQSLRSAWVMFELGAAWGLNRDIYPILEPGLHISDLPGPLNQLPCIEIESTDSSSRTSDLIQQLTEDLELSRKNGGKAQANMESFISQFRKIIIDNPKSSEANKPPEDQEEVVLLSIWKMAESKYDKHGYSLERISADTTISIPKCQHVLNQLIKKNLVEVRELIGGTESGKRYTLKQAGSALILEKKLAD